MKTLFLFAVATISLPALAAPQAWVPIKDSRFDFTLCGSEGTINLNKADAVQGCVGKIAGTKIDVLVIRPANGRNLDVFHIVEQKMTSQFGGQEGGERDWDIKIKRYDMSSGDDSGRQTTLKMKESWEYSSGVTLLDGKSPDGDKIDLSLDDVNQPLAE